MFQNIENATMNSMVNMSSKSDGLGLADDRKQVSEQYGTLHIGQVYLAN